MTRQCNDDTARQQRQQQIAEFFKLPFFKRQFGKPNSNIVRNDNNNLLVSPLENRLSS
jgi:hypothetical protein